MTEASRAYGRAWWHEHREEQNARRRRVRKAIAERFWAKVDVRGPDECWPWLGHRKEFGHGAFWLNGTMTIASRVAYELEKGPLNGQWALHTCDNPPCCNPAHLYAGDHAANVADRQERDRNVNKRGADHPMAKLSDGQVLEIRRRSAAGEDSKALAHEFGVTYEAIWRIATRRSWASL